MFNNVLTKRLIFPIVNYLNIRINISNKLATTTVMSTEKASIDENKADSKFRKSKDVEFCQLHRTVPGSGKQAASGQHFGFDAKTLQINQNSTTFDVSNGSNLLHVQLNALHDGKIVQLRIEEASPNRKPFKIPNGDVVTYQSLNTSQLEKQPSPHSMAKFASRDGCRICINFNPFRIDFGRQTSGERPLIRFNADGLLKFLESSQTPVKSVGADFTFVGCSNLYGLPEHADSLRLKRTVGDEPYRLYNVDSFAYPLNSRASLYGSVPFVLAPTLRSGGNSEASGLLWLNPSESWVDVNYRARPKRPKEAWTHFMSETGFVDVFIFTGPTMRDVIWQYSSLVGRYPLPPLFALGYHQSRWNYNDQDDVLDVNQMLNRNDIPCDVIWLDIEHTDSKKYFTWDYTKFPKPLEMLDALRASGRRLVNIVDPHLKRDKDYSKFNEAKSKDFFIKDTTGGRDFDGNCWPGSSAWPDFTRVEVRQWWSDQFAYDKYPDTNERVYIWNDMNEPSVFHGAELTLPKDAKHFRGLEHREVHNLYGHYQAMATFNGLMKRSQNQRRPFLLTRSFFAGTQRYAAVWTGDNVASWGYLRATTPMLLSLSICGITLCGSDIGGFHLDPDEELLTRWFQAAAFHPFFREHSHIQRREPWLFSKEANARLRNAVRRRYSYLPYWYTLFYESEQTGVPPMRPLWFEFPKDSKTYAIDGSFMVGDALLVHPIYRPKKRYVDFYLPGNGLIWYRADHWSKKGRRKGGRSVMESVSMEEIPVYQKGGSIVPRWMHPRRSSEAMHGDRLTLIVCLDRQGKAEGRLYADGYDGYQYRDGKFVYFSFKFEDNTLKCRRLSGDLKLETMLEKITVVGTRANRKPVRVTLQNAVLLDFNWNLRNHSLEIALPKKGFSMTTNNEFDIVVSYEKC